MLLADMTTVVKKDTLSSKLPKAYCPCSELTIGMETSIKSNTVFLPLDLLRATTNQRGLSTLEVRNELMVSGAGFVPPVGGFIAQQPPYGTQTHQPAPPPQQGQPYFEYSTCQLASPSTTGADCRLRATKGSFDRHQLLWYQGRTCGLYQRCAQRTAIHQRSASRFTVSMLKLIR